MAGTTPSTCESPSGEAYIVAQYDKENCLKSRDTIVLIM